MAAATLSEAIDRIRSWSMNEGRVNHPRAQVGAIFGSLVFNDSVQQARLPKAVYQALRDTVTKGTSLDDVHGRRRGLGLEGLGRGTRGVALHALVPAHDRHHRREARLVLLAHRRRRLDGRVQRQGTGQGGARRLELSVGRHAQHLRGPRLHRLGPDQPAVAAGHRQLGHPGHSDGVRELDRRVTRQEDAAAPLDGSAVGAGHPRAEAVWRAGLARDRHVRTRAGILPDRPALLLQPARPHQRRAHAVRRPSAQGAGAGRPVLRGHPRARAGLHGRGRDRALQGGRADQDAPQRSGPVAVRAGADLREHERRHRPPDDDDGGAEAHRAEVQAWPA